MNWVKPGVLISQSADSTAFTFLAVLVLPVRAIPGIDPE